MFDKLPTITFLSFFGQTEEKLDFTIFVNAIFVHYNLRVEKFPANLTSICSIRVKSLDLNLGCFDSTRKIFEAPTFSELFDMYHRRKTTMEGLDVYENDLGLTFDVSLTSSFK